MSRFLGSYTRYITHLFAYLTLTADPYPPFSGQPGYIVDLEIDEPEDPRQSRLKTLFRLVLAIPALLISGILIGVPGPPGSSSTYEPQPGGGYESTSTEVEAPAPGSSSSRHPRLVRDLGRRPPASRLPRAHALGSPLQRADVRVPLHAHGPLSRTATRSSRRRSRPRRPSPCGSASRTTSSGRG